MPDFKVYVPTNNSFKFIFLNIHCKLFYFAATAIFNMHCIGRFCSKIWTCNWIYSQKNTCKIKWSTLLLVSWIIYSMIVTFSFDTKLCVMQFYKFIYETSFEQILIFLTSYFYDRQISCCTCIYMIAGDNTRHMLFVTMVTTYMHLLLATMETTCSFLMIKNLLLRIKLPIRLSFVVLIK